MTDPMETFELFLERFPRLRAFYYKWNFCKGSYADGTPKPHTLFSRAFQKIFYLECSCCSAIRGLIAGFVLGVLAHMFWRWLPWL